MKLLVFGKTGQVAQALAHANFSSVDSEFVGRQEADLRQPGSCRRIILDRSADAVLNLAAYTAVDRAESERELAFCVNSEAPGIMAEACAMKRIPFLHVSTDYVYDGSGEEPFPADEQTGPLNVYGVSKLLGEFAIRQSGAHHLILRTSWIFSALGDNFCTTILRRAMERTRISVVSDQVGGPTPASSLALALVTAARALVNGSSGGTFNFAGYPDVSRSEFAKSILSLAGVPCHVDEIRTMDFPSPARRPLNSRLDCRNFERTYGVVRPQWRPALEETLKKLRAQQ